MFSKNQRNLAIILIIFVVLVVLSMQLLPVAAVTSEDEHLYWAPPELFDPVTVEVPPGESYGVYYLDVTRDYIIQMPDTPVNEDLKFVGGRNLVIIGGEINIGWQGEDPSIQSRTALRFFDNAGTIHIEGLLIHGDDLSEGIQFNAPNAIVQIQNVAVMGVHARDQVNFSDNHPDIIQTYGNVAAIRIDGLTGSTDYQGLFFKTDSNGAHGPVHVRRTNIIGLPTARHLLWFEQEAGAGDVLLEDVYLDVPEERYYGIANAVWPSLWGEYPDQAQTIDTGEGCPCVYWPPEMINPRVAGLVYSGRPPEGDFVNLNEVGIGYVSPGYRTSNTTELTSTETSTELPTEVTITSTSILIPSSTPTLTHTPTQVPSSTPIPTMTTMQIHVGDIDAWSPEHPSANWDAYVSITVHDQNENPVANVTVMGTWSIDSSIGQCVTDATGSCTIVKERINRNRDGVSTNFNISNLVHAEYIYAAQANHDVDGDSSGFTITVQRNS